MVVRFACPQGHGIQAGDSMVGSPGKCPRCGSSYIVPDPDKTFLFLCPNGHRLNGPKSLQGKPGQCPHCGSTFRIPVLNDEEEEPPAPGAAMSSTSLEGEQWIVDDIEAAPEFEEDGDVAHHESSLRHPRPSPPQKHPLAIALERLWDRVDGGAVELHLTDGAKLQIVSFAPELSRGSHVVAAVRGENDLLRVTALPWDTIVRVELPESKELPEDLFL